MGKERRTEGKGQEDQVGLATSRENNTLSMLSSLREQEAHLYEKELPGIGCNRSLRRSFSDTSVASQHGFGSPDLKLVSFRSKNVKLGQQSPSRRRNGLSSIGTTKKEWIIDLKNIDLIKTMGAGGSGEVWHGLWQGLDVAVKILYRQGGHVFGMDRMQGQIPKNLVKVERKFQSEVQSLSSLRHPNIVLFMGACNSHVKVMNVQNAELQYGIVTEYMSGGSIHDHIHKQDWVQTASPKLLRRVVKDITLGMIYLHNEDIIHRDLKSRNILTDNNWHVKIADFDLSRIKQTTIYKNDPSSSLIGTPSWMAPELIQGLQYDEKVDVYSFAMVLFELFSGEIPFASLYGREMNHVRIVYDVVKHCARPLLPEYIPEPMKVLISKCWAQDPRERPSFSQILSVLNEENATEKYFCHIHNSYLLDEDEILSISARSLCTATPASTHRLSPSLVGSSPPNSVDTSSMSLQPQGSPAAVVQRKVDTSSSRMKNKSTKFPMKFSKWIKKLFKHI